MSVFVYIIGLMLVVAGAAFISMGVPIARLEIGWCEIIGGAVAGSSGFVVLALGVVVTRLESLRQAVVGLALAREVALSPLAEPDAAWERADTRPPFAPHPLAPAASLAGIAAAETAGAVMLHLEPGDDLVEPAHRTEDLASSPAAAEPMVEPEPPLMDASLHPEAEAFMQEADEAPAPEPPPHDELDAGAPSIAATGDVAPPVAPVEPLMPAVPEDADETGILPFPPPPSPPPELARRPNFLAAFLARRNAGLDRPAAAEPHPLPEPFAPPSAFESRASPPRPSVDLSSGWDPAPAHHAPPDEVVPPADDASPPGDAMDEYEPEPAPHEEPLPAPADEPPLRGTLDEGDEERVADGTPPAQAEPAAPFEGDAALPVVVGRYNAGSATYIMYSSGMIEVETDSGTHRFSSMQELKAFIERRDAARV